ncbi:MAG: metallophosphoesterase [Nocardioides sp.]
MFDLIGDIHGHAAELEELLRRLGYRHRAGAWRHPERTAIFVGDFLDRGPQIRETLRLVREMLEAGSARAVLGNHEWNAFAFHQPDPDLPGEFLRRHFEKNVHQVAATLAQVPAPELASHLAFLRTLPIRLELPLAGDVGGLGSIGGGDGLRVVHACWDEVAFAVIDEALARHGGISEAFLVEGSNPESLLFAALEIVLKGKEMAAARRATRWSTRTASGASWRACAGTRRRQGQTVASYALPHFPHLSPAPLPAQGRRRGATLSAGGAAGLLRPLLARPTPAPAALAPNVVLPRLLGRTPGGFLCGYRLRRRRRNGTFVTVR